MAYKFDIILDILKAIAFLPDDSQMRVVKSCISYLTDTLDVELQEVERMAVMMLLPRLKEAKEKEERLRQKRSNCGKQGGRGKAKKAIALLALDKEPLLSSLPSSPTPPISISSNLQENNITTAHTPTCVREEENFEMVVGVLASEEKYIQQYRQENTWTDAAMISHLKIDEVKRFFDEFCIEQKHNSYKHSDYSDFKRHFLNYLRVKAEIIRKQSKTNDYGVQRKYDDRRSTEVNPSADFDKPL